MSRAGSSSPISVGVDIVETDRVRRLLSYGTRRLQGIFTPRELRNLTPYTIAAVFAVKEAVFKALGRGWGQGLRWTDVRVGWSVNGVWSVELVGEAFKRLGEMGGSRLVITVGIAGNHAIAQATVFKYQNNKIQMSK